MKNKIIQIIEEYNSKSVASTRFYSNKPIREILNSEGVIIKRVTFNDYLIICYNGDKFHKTYLSLPNEKLIGRNHRKEVMFYAENLSKLCDYDSDEKDIVLALYYDTK